MTINNPETIRDALLNPGTWAVVGLSHKTSRTAYGIAKWLKDTLGHTIVPVHPSADEVFGETGYARLTDIPDGTRVDVVDCFVRSELVGPVVDEAIAQKDRLGIHLVWLQLGVVDEAAAQRAEAAGLQVVMDTCPRIEYPKIA